MSSGDLSRYARSRPPRSTTSRTSNRTHELSAVIDVPSPIPDLPRTFEPCAATASFFLYAQSNTVLVLHHDTLAIERRFEKHRNNVLLLVADNISERGAGRLVVSYDVSQTAIIWDIFTGEEVARFASYEQVTVAAFMRNGAIAFGNSQGNITLFEIDTSEHISARTIFDPITALAPNSDCRTFAIGFRNGSILIATLQPFTVLHTLTHNRAPSLVSGLSWHGTSSKAKGEMLASQSADGTLLVWSIAKSQYNEQPRVIRYLAGPEGTLEGSCWFSWSKNGRLLHYIDGQMKSWDVRTKQVQYQSVPTVDNPLAIANYGPTATLFTVSHNSMVQQYDVNPQSEPMLVMEMRHAPPNAPPTPPDSVGLIGNITPPPMSETPGPPESIEIYSSEDDEGMMSPLEKIAKEMDQLEEERRDRVGPLSPVSSHASLSSASSNGRSRYKSRSRARAFSSKSSDVSDGTHFTGLSGATKDLRVNHQSISLRSVSSAASAGQYQYRNEKPSRPEVPRAPDDDSSRRSVDLFPFTKARLSEVKFRTPQFGSGRVTPDALRQEMLSVVFGWDHDIDSLVRDEQNRHMPGSTSAVLLSKWLGDLGADASAQRIGSETMTSSDWMLLALSSMGQGSQKQIGESFVRRLLETDDVHPAVAILLGLGEHNDAVEAYVSRKYFLEAILLTCLVFPHDWQRQSHLLRKWGEAAVTSGQAELAVRCFSCTSVESSEAWFSPRAQDEAFSAQQELFNTPISPPSATTPSRLTAKNASLKLITTFAGNDKSAPKKSHLGVAASTDVVAASPGGSRYRSTSKGTREPSTARTATPGGFKRNRMPSSGPQGRHLDDDATPLPVTARVHSRANSAFGERDPDTAVKTSRRNLSESLPSPAPGIFNRHREGSRPRDLSRDRNFHNLHLKVGRTIESDLAASPGPTTNSSSTASSSHRHQRSTSSLSQETRPEDFSPLLTDGSSQSFKGRSIDRYIASLEDSHNHAQHLRAESRSRLEQRHERSRSRARKNSDTTFIKPGKRSPSSPKSMSTEEATRFATATAAIEPLPIRDTASEAGHERLGSVSSAAFRARTRERSRQTRRNESPESRAGVRSASKSSHVRAVSRARSSRPDSPDGSNLRDDRGRSQNRRAAGLGNRSPSSPSPMDVSRGEQPTYETVGARARQRSSSRRPGDSGRRTSSPERSRARSSSRKVRAADMEVQSATSDRRFFDIAEEQLMELNKKREELAAARNEQPDRPLTRKELAARELEQRRLSLARRPSAPMIPSPNEFVLRPGMGQRSMTDLDGSASSAQFLSSATYTPAAEFGHQRSRTVDPESMSRQLSSTATKPVIGLPATPRAMRLPKYMRSDSKDDVPAIPALPESNAEDQPTTAQQEEDTLGPLLPSTVYGQKAPPRSASAPPERSAPPPQTGLPQRPRKNSASSNHGRRGSEAPSSLAPAVEELNEEDEPSPNVIIVEPSSPEHRNPAILPELQHLAGPPPPPPPPPMFPSQTLPSTTYGASQGVSPAPSSGVINVFIDANGTASSSPAPPPPPPHLVSGISTVASPPIPSASPNLSRKTHASGDSISSKLRQVRDRMRSESRGRALNTRSPPAPDSAVSQTMSPYETVLPHMTASYFSQAAAVQHGGGHGASPGQTILGSNGPSPGINHEEVAAGIPRAGSAGIAAYRNPKEIRAGLQQQGLQGLPSTVYNPAAQQQQHSSGGGMI